MKSIISFSLYGHNPLYCQGAIENARLCPLAYAGWEAWFYLHAHVDRAIVDAIEGLGGRVVIVDETGCNERETITRSAFWRFRALDAPDVTRVIFRDVDSRVSPREAKAVDQWVQSGRPFHFMYDHPYHTTPIMAGMWGAVVGTIPSINDEMTMHFETTAPLLAEDRASDQAFLRETIFTRYITRQNVLVHAREEVAPYAESLGLEVLPFPPHPAFYSSGTSPQRFVGETIVVPGSLPKPVRRETGQLV